MAFILSSLASAASGAIHPISTTRQHANNVLYGDPRLEAFCQQMIRANRNPTTEEFEAIADTLEDLIENPADYGITEGLDEAFSDELQVFIPAIRGSLENPDSITLDPIFTLFSRYRGIVPNLRFEIESTITSQKHAAVEDIQRVIAAQFQEPEMLKALVGLMPNCAHIPDGYKAQIAAWRGAIVEPDTLKLVVFGHQRPLKEDESVLLEHLYAHCEACADAEAAIEIEDLIDLRTNLKRILESRTGAIKKLEALQKRLLEETVATLKEAQDSAIKPLSLPFKELFEKASLYHRNKTPANLAALNEKIQAYQVTLEATDPERLFFVAQAENTFEEFFTLLKEKKKAKQGMLFEALDVLFERFHDFTSPLTSFFSPESEADTEPSSLFDKAIRLIENASGNGIKTSITFIFSSVFQWIQKTQFPKATEEEKRLFTQFFATLLEEIDRCDFSKKEQRSALIKSIKEKLSTTPIMIDQFLALPALLDTTFDTNIEELKAALSTESHEALSAWITRIGGIDNIDEVLFFDESLGISVQDQAHVKENIIRISNNASFDKEIQAKLRKWIELNFTTAADMEVEVLEGIAYEKASAKKESAFEGSLEDLSLRFSETTTFYLVYEICSKLLGFNTATLDRANQEKIAEIVRQGKTASEKAEAYAAWQLDNHFDERNQHSFKNFIESLKFSDDRKEEFISHLQTKIQFFEGNPVLINFLTAIIPYLVMIIEPICAHFITRSMTLVLSLSQFSSSDPSKRINTKLIRIISGYFNKISSIYKEIPEKNRSQSVADYLKQHLKKDIMVDGESFSIKEIFSEVNFELVSAYFPDITLSSYLDAVSRFMLDEFSSNSSSDLLKNLLILPAYAILQIFNLVVVKPIENLFGYVGKHILWRMLNITGVLQSVVETAFSKFNESTGLYHIIKEPLAQVLEDIDFDSADEADEAEEKEDHSAILSQQDAAKKDLNEMYRSMKEAIAWFNQGISKQDIIKILHTESKDPTSQSLVDRIISQIETKFLSDIIAEGLLVTIHKITQAQFLEETILKKGLIAGIRAFEGLGHVLSLSDIEDKHLKMISSDTKFQKLSKKAMSKLFDKIFKKALADLGAKQKKSIDQFIQFVNGNFSGIELVKFDEYADKDPMDKIIFLDKLQKDLQAMMVNYQSQKEALLDDPSINDALKTIIKRKVIPFEKILATVFPVIKDELDRLKEVHEKVIFKSQFEAIAEKRTLLIGKLKSLKTQLASDEIVDFTAVVDDLRSIDAECKKIEYGHKILLSKESQTFKLELAKLTTEFQDYNQKLKEFDARKRIEKIFLDQLPLIRQGIGLDSCGADLDPAALLESAKTALLTPIRQDLPPTEIVAFERDLARLPQESDKETILKRLNERVLRWQTEISDQLDRLTFLELPGFKGESTVTLAPKPAVDFELAIAAPLARVKDLCEKVTPIDYLSISVAEHTPLLKTGKKIILKQLREEVEKYKKFFSSPENLETFFYNCILPSLAM